MCARARALATGRREAAGWEGAHAPAGRRPGPRTPRRRTAASAPTVAAPTDPGRAQPQGVPVGTRRPLPPQLRHPQVPLAPGPARGPWLLAGPPCAPFPSADLRARESGQGGEEEKDGDEEATPRGERHEERGDGAPHRRDPEGGGRREVGERPGREGKDPERGGDRGSERERDPERKDKRRGWRTEKGIERKGDSKRGEDRDAKREMGTETQEGIDTQKGDGSSDRGRWRVGQERFLRLSHTSTGIPFIPTSPGETAH